MGAYLARTGFWGYIIAPLWEEYQGIMLVIIEGYTLSKIGVCTLGTCKNVLDVSCPTRPV